MLPSVSTLQTMLFSRIAQGVPWFLIHLSQPFVWQEHLIENEVSILRRVKHPNIIMLVEEMETATELFLVMELVKVRGWRDFKSFHWCHIQRLTVFLKEKCFAALKLDNYQF